MRSLLPYNSMFTMTGQTPLARKKVFSSGKGKHFIVTPTKLKRIMEMAHEASGYDDINHPNTRREAVERFMWDTRRVEVVWPPWTNKPVNSWWPGSHLNKFLMASKLLTSLQSLDSAGPHCPEHTTKNPSEAIQTAVEITEHPAQELMTKPQRPTASKFLLTSLQSLDSIDVEPCCPEHTTKHPFEAIQTAVEMTAHQSTVEFCPSVPAVPRLRSSPPGLSMIHEGIICQTASTLPGPRRISVKASGLISDITLAISSLECDEKFPMRSLQRGHSSVGFHHELIEI